jgi:hypothetical protein
MARHDINIAIKARDEASRTFGIVGTSATTMGSMIRKAAAYAAVYLSARAIKRFTEESLAAYGEQEAALKKLTDALSLLGPVSAKAVKDYEAFADQIQKTTVIGDEEVLALMAQGAAMGKMSGKELQEATKAAIGLSRAYGIELVAAMRLVSRARVGDTSTLTKYGIKLEEGLNKHEKFNRILEDGARNFRLAEGEADTYTGRVIQMKNALGEVKEAIGEALMPTFKDAALRIRDWAYDNKQRIGEWAKATIAWIEDIKDAFLEFVRFMQEDWKSGLRFALDVFLELLAASFKTAVTMAIAGGRGIAKGVKQGLLGGEPEGLYQATEEAYKKEAKPPDIETLTSPEKLDAYYKNRWERWKAIEDELRPQFQAKETEDILGGSIEAVRKQWREAWDDIVKKAPPEFAKNVVDALRENAEARFGREMERGAGISAAGVPAAPETVKESIAGTRRGVRAQEVRMLPMFAPGKATEYPDHILKAIKEEVKIQEKVLKVMTQVEQTMRRYFGGTASAKIIELGTTAFT